MANLGNENRKSETTVWLTPPYILNALGEFDLDPCAPINRPWDMAANHYTIEEDGLLQPWFGRVWCNPPYGSEMSAFLEKLSHHEGGGIALIFARTETKAFFNYVWDRADALLFLKGRIRFHRPDGSLGDNSGAPSVLVAYGKAEVESLRSSGLEGKLVVLD